MTTQQTIPLHQLVHCKANVRHTGKTHGIDELAASIAAHGLRQNLNVMPSADGRRFEVVAGARRLRALKQLAKAGTLAKNAPIACLVLGVGDDPAEISLVENMVRVAMHPDDQVRGVPRPHPRTAFVRRGCRRPVWHLPCPRATAPETRACLAQAARALPQGRNGTGACDGARHQRRPRRAGRGMGQPARLEP